MTLSETVLSLAFMLSVYSFSVHLNNTTTTITTTAATTTNNTDTLRASVDDTTVTTTTTPYYKRFIDNFYANFYAKNKDPIGHTSGQSGGGCGRSGGLGMGEGAASNNNLNDKNNDPYCHSRSFFTKSSHVLGTPAVSYEFNSRILGPYRRIRLNFLQRNGNGGDGDGGDRKHNSHDSSGSSSSNSNNNDGTTDDRRNDKPSSNDDSITVKIFTDSFACAVPDLMVLALNEAECKTTDRSSLFTENTTGTIPRASSLSGPLLTGERVVDAVVFDPHPLDDVSNAYADIRTRSGLTVFGFQTRDVRTGELETNRATYVILSDVMNVTFTVCRRPPPPPRQTFRKQSQQQQQQQQRRRHYADDDDDGRDKIDGVDIATTIMRDKLKSKLRNFNAAAAAANAENRRYPDDGPTTITATTTTDDDDNDDNDDDDDDDLTSRKWFEKTMTFVIRMHCVRYVNCLQNFYNKLNL